MSSSSEPQITTPTFSLTISPSSTIHPTPHPSQPLYFLPTSLSTHSITLPILRSIPPTPVTTKSSGLSRSSIRENPLFSITKIPTTDTYTFISHVPGRGGKGVVSFVSGWIWGGVWEAEFGFFDESKDRERKLVLKCPSGPSAQWKLSEAEVVFSGGGDGDEEGEGEESAAATKTGAIITPEIVIAEEQSSRHPAPAEGGEEGAERGETILIHTGKKECEEIVREFLTVAWVVKCWSERTRGGWLMSSVKKKDEGAGGLKYNY